VTDVKTISVLIEYDPETKTYGATSPELPDVYAVSDSRDDVLDRFASSANEYLTYLRERNQPLPSFAIRHEVVTIALPAAS
jgi:predicted RNase H-like HicB family nuclease